MAAVEQRQVSEMKRCDPFTLIMGTRRGTSTFLERLIEDAGTAWRALYDNCAVTLNGSRSLDRAERAEMANLLHFALAHVDELLLAHRGSGLSAADITATCPDERTRVRDVMHFSLFGAHLAVIENDEPAERPGEIQCLMDFDDGNFGGESPLYLWHLGGNTSDIPICPYVVDNEDEIKEATERARKILFNAVLGCLKLGPILWRSEAIMPEDGLYH